MDKDSTLHDNYQPDREINLNSSERYLLQFWNFYQQLGRLQKKTFWTLHYFSIKYKDVSPSQKKIGKIAKCSREHVNKLIALLCRENFLKKQRKMCKNNRYFLAPFLRKSDLKSQIDALLGRLSALGLNAQDFTSNFTSLSKLSNLPNRTTKKNRNSKKDRDKPKKGPPPVKEFFDGLRWPERDKQLFSRYDDRDIEYAFNQLSGYMQLYGNEAIRSPVKFFQSKLDESKKGGNRTNPSPLYMRHFHKKGLNISIQDMQTFNRYPEASIVLALDRSEWYQSQNYTIGNMAAFLHTIIKNNFRG